MQFEDYIEIGKLINIEIYVKKSSSRTLDEIKEIVVNRVNNVESGYDVKATVIDLRDGNTYVCFSQNMMKAYEITEQFNKSLDMVAIDKFLKEDLETKKKEFLDGLNDVFTDVVSDETVKELEKINYRNCNEMS